MCTFPKLAEAIQIDAEQRKERARHFVLCGYMPSWAKHNRTDADRGIKSYSTVRTWEQYQRGEIDRETAAKRAIKRAERGTDRATVAKLDNLLRAASADDFEAVNIWVHWSHNATWGSNPTADVTVYSRTGVNFEGGTGRASGCGYDKRSAAVASALNQCDSVLKVLYTAAESALQSGNAPTQHENGLYSWRDILGCGNGCDILPRFEGGVGVECYWRTLRNLGFDVDCNERGKHDDFYMIARKEG